MKIVYSPSSQTDLLEIHSYVSEYSPAAADMIVRRVKEVIDKLLVQFPEIGRNWDNGSTRALSIAGIPYRVHYEVVGDEIHILRIYHTSRLPPKL